MPYTTSGQETDQACYLMHALVHIGRLSTCCTNADNRLMNKLESLMVFFTVNKGDVLMLTTICALCVFFFNCVVNAVD